jgi:thiamine-phosphate pyrophosphorylase
VKGLYAIIDPEHCDGRDPLWVAGEVLHGGCAAMQLRAKTLSDRLCLSLARGIAECCAEHGVPFWMNDRPDLALLSGASGLHLGQGDLALDDARSLFPGALALSTNTLAQAREAASLGVDAIGFGPIFATSSKTNADPSVGLEALREVCCAVSIPVIAIGGITLEHAAAVASTGASYAAAIGAICRAFNPHVAARELHDALRAG